MTISLSVNGRHVGLLAHRLGLFLDTVVYGRRTAQPDRRYLAITYVSPILCGKDDRGAHGSSSNLSVCTPLLSLDRCSRADTRAVRSNSKYFEQPCSKSNFRMARCASTRGRCVRSK